MIQEEGRNSLSDLFCYGTLQHAPLLSAVLGRDADQLDMEPATLADHIVQATQAQEFPILLPKTGTNAAGTLVRGLSEADIGRLDFYEIGFDLGADPIEVETADGTVCSARVFFPEPGLWVPDGPWSLERWVMRHGALTTRAAAEVMAHMGTYAADEILARYHPIRMRAAGWVAAQNRPADPERNVDTDVVVHRHHRPYMNFFAVEELDFQYRRYDGSMSAVVNRGALMMGEAAVVLPYDPVRDEVLLVEQFRTPVYLGGSRAPWIWEPIAGLMDPGESPEDCARREAMEEAGLTLRALDAVGPAYSSTGSSSDYVYMYIGLTDLGEAQDPGGLEAEGEDIRSRILPFAELMEKIDNQGFYDMPLFVTALWLARHRDRLRAMA